MVPLGRVVRGQLGQDAVDLIDALMGQKPVDVSKAALLNREQIALFVPQVADIVDERHEQI